MSIRVTEAELDIAILWLESNEGGGEEQAGCEKVAAWLKAELEDRQIKKIMRDHKVNRDMAKTVLARLRAQKTTEQA